MDFSAAKRGAREWAVVLAVAELPRAAGGPTIKPHKINYLRV